MADTPPLGTCDVCHSSYVGIHRMPDCPGRPIVEPTPDRMVTVSADDLALVVRNIRARGSVDYLLAARDRLRAALASVPTEHPALIAALGERDGAVALLVGSRHLYSDTPSGSLWLFDKWEKDRDAFLASLPSGDEG